MTNFIIPPTSTGTFSYFSVIPETFLMVSLLLTPLLCNVHLVYWHKLCDAHALTSSAFCDVVDHLLLPTARTTRLSLLSFTSSFRPELPYHRPMFFFSTASLSTLEILLGENILKEWSFERCWRQLFLQYQWLSLIQSHLNFSPYQFLQWLPW